MDKNSTEFDYSGKGDTTREIKRSGPSWLLIILIMTVSIRASSFLGWDGYPSDLRDDRTSSFQQALKPKPKARLRISEGSA